MQMGNTTWFCTRLMYKFSWLWPTITIPVFGGVWRLLHLWFYVAQQIVLVAPTLTDSQSFHCLHISTFLIQDKRPVKRWNDTHHIGKGWEPIWMYTFYFNSTFSEPFAAVSGHFRLPCVTEWLYTIDSPTCLFSHHYGCNNNNTCLWLSLAQYEDSQLSQELRGQITDPITSQKIIIWEKVDNVRGDTADRGSTWCATRWQGRGGWLQVFCLDRGFEKDGNLKLEAVQAEVRQGVSQYSIFINLSNRLQTSQLKEVWNACNSVQKVSGFVYSDKGGLNITDEEDNVWKILLTVSAVSYLHDRSTTVMTYS